MLVSKSRSERKRNMTGEKQETRAEEVARVRSYLANQAMKRTPAQLVDVLREAHQQFLGATAAVPDEVFQIAPKDGEWSAADVLDHVLTIAAYDLKSIPAVIERGEQPSDVLDLIRPASSARTRELMLVELERL